MKISDIVYKNSKCILVQNEKYEIIIPLEYGLRILSFKDKNSFNFLGEDIDVSRKFENDSWHIRGGHRLWHTPEEFPRTYLPDNDMIDYKIDNERLILIQKINKKTQIQKKMILEFVNNGKELMIEHILINKGLWPISTAAWAITILKTGGIATVPLNKRKDDLLSTKAFSLWSYCDLSDKRINFKKDIFTLKQDINNKNSFKIGTNNEEGYASYELDGYKFKKSFNFFKDKNYPDKGCSFEIFTDDKVLELETLSPIYCIKPNEEISHTEKWSISEIE
jgi:hypothetical protein